MGMSVPMFFVSPMKYKTNQCSHNRAYSSPNAPVCIPEDYASANFLSLYSIS